MGVRTRTKLLELLRPAQEGHAPRSMMKVLSVLLLSTVTTATTSLRGTGTAADISAPDLHYEFTSFATYAPEDGEHGVSVGVVSMVSMG